MIQKSRQEKKFSRRRFFPLVGGTLLIPFFGFGNSDPDIDPDSGDTYETLLKPDGTTVKVKVSAIKKSKVVKKNVSNKSMLKWLKKKF